MDQVREIINPPETEIPLRSRVRAIGKAISKKPFLFFLLSMAFSLFWLGLIPVIVGDGPRLPILPEAGLSKSLYLPVLIGLLLMTLFTETLGWNYSGLVVPGYLTPLILIKPWSFTLIVVEALLTYLVVRTLANLPTKVGYWSAFFGRDRFFMILAVSIGVRIFVETWGIDFLVNLLADTPLHGAMFRSNLYSIGLIVVPLLANMFWNSGLARGLFPVTFTVFLTFLIVHYVVVPYTNYSVSNIEILYEDLALDFMFSSKHYLVLIITAFIASRANMKYGWDFSGILVPSLLALAWLTPIKIGATVVEAVTILLVSRFVTQRNFMKNISLEGPRKILLLFSIGFLIKWVAGFVIGSQLPGFKVTDLFGFGFLLPSLIAVKMWQRGSFNQILGPILRVSLVGVILGNALGFSLYLMDRYKFESLKVQRVENYHSQVVLPETRLLPEVLLNKAFVKRCIGEASPVRPMPNNIDLLMQTTRTLLALPRYPSIREINDAMQKYQTSLLEIDFDLTHFTDGKRVRYVVLQNRKGALELLQGWGGVVINTGTQSNLVIEVPYPLSEPYSLETAAILFQKLDARALVVSGSDNLGQGSQSADVLNNSSLPYHEWHRLFSEYDVLRVRTDTEMPHLEPILDIAKEFPAEISQRQLRVLLGELRLHWKTGADLSLLDWFGRGTSQELRLGSYVAQRVLGESMAESYETFAGDQNLETFLDERWKRGEGQLFAPVGLWRIEAPDVREKMAFVTEILTRLHDIAEHPDPVFDSVRIQAINAYAGLMGYAVLDYRDTDRKERYFYLHETSRLPRYWGSFVFRVGTGLPIAIEIPRPATEFNTVSMGFWLFENLYAKAMFWPGSKTNPNANPLSDVLSRDSRDMPFNLAHQELQLGSRGKTRRLGVIQVRGFSELDHPTQDNIVMSIGREISTEEQLSDFQRNVNDMVGEYGLRVDYFDGSPEMVDFGVYANAQYAFSARCCDEDFLTLWIPRNIRRSLLQITRPESIERICREQQYPVRDGVFDHTFVLPANNDDAGVSTSAWELLDRTSETMLNYKAYRNPNFLAQVLGTWNEAGFDAACVRDADHQRVYLVLRSQESMTIINPYSLANTVEYENIESGKAIKALRLFREGKMMMLHLSERRP